MAGFYTGGAGLSTRPAQGGSVVSTPVLNYGQSQEKQGSARMRRMIGLGLFGGLAVLTATVALPAPAHAACVLSGGTVICTGSDDNGFTGGNALTVRVEANAAVDSVYDDNPDTVCPAFRAALRLGLNAQVTNLGQIAGRGNCAVGVESGNGLTLTNDGIILADSQVSFAVLTTDAFNVVNRGTFSTTNSGGTGFVGVNGGTFVNTATGVIETFGAGASGIVAENANTLTNAGRITLRGAGSFGMDLGASNTVTNTGTITATGVASAGIRLRGTGNTLTNGGTITALPAGAPRDGEDSIGVLAESGGNTISTSGQISGDYAGVSMNGANNTLINGGTISARAPTAATMPGGGVVVGGGGAAIINSGIIRGTGSVAVRVRADSSLSLTSSGVIDGEIVLGNGGSSLRLIGGSVRGAIRGSATGTDTLILEGNGSLSVPVLNFDVIEKRVGGSWSTFSSGTALEATQSITITDGRIDALGYRAPRVTIGRNGALYGPIVITGVRTGTTTFADTLLHVEGTLFAGASASSRQEVTAVQGDVELTASSVVAARLSAGFGDLLSATGRITLAGGGLSVSNGISPPVDAANYTVISAAALRSDTGIACSGTLSDTGARTGNPCLGALSDTWPAFIRTNATVTPTSVIVQLQRIPYASVAQSSEALAVASFLDFARVNVGGLFGLIPLIDTMTIETARSVFTTFSSDLPVALQTWNVLAGDTLAKTVSPWMELARADSAKGQWRTWGSVMIRDGSGAPRLDPGHFDYDVKGVVAGTDVAVADGTRLGIMASTARGRVFLPTGPASARVTTIVGGVYIAQAWERWRAGAGVLIGDGDAAMTRQRLSFNATTDSLAAKTNTTTDTAFAQASYSIPSGFWLLKPMAMLTYVNAKTDPFNEGGAFALKVAGQEDSTLRGEIGLRALATPGPVHVVLGVFWSQNFNGNARNVAADGFGFPGSAFTINGHTEKRGWLNTQAGVNIEVVPGLMARLGWSGILNDRLGGHTATAGLSYRW